MFIKIWTLSELISGDNIFLKYLQITNNKQVVYKPRLFKSNS